MGAVEVSVYSRREPASGANDEQMQGRNEKDNNE